VQPPVAVTNFSLLLSLSDGALHANSKYCLQFSLVLAKQVDDGKLCVSPGVSPESASLAGNNRKWKTW